MKMNDIMKLVEAGQLKEIHTSMMRGYISRKLLLEDLTAAKYDGKFGKGYTVMSARFDSTQYCNITYFLEV